MDSDNGSILLLRIIVIARFRRDGREEVAFDHTIQFDRRKMNLREDFDQELSFGQHVCLRQFIFQEEDHFQRSRAISWEFDSRFYSMSPKPFDYSI